MNNWKFIKCTTIILVFTLGILLSGCSKQNNKNVENPSSQKNTATTQEKPKSEKGTNDKNPVVTMKMENGAKIKIELYPEIAPNTVRNFISLTQKGFYNGLIFHRVIPEFMIQGGDPDGTGTGGPGYSIKGEFDENDFKNELKHERGVISMARSSEPNSGGSQFFIMVNDKSHLDGQYAAFGKVIEGLDEVDKIVSAKRDENDKPLKDEKMKKVTVDTFGVKYKDVEIIK